jgi:hypothetical protein
MSKDTVLDMVTANGTLNTAQHSRAGKCSPGKPRRWEDNTEMEGTYEGI